MGVLSMSPFTKFALVIAIGQVLSCIALPAVRGGFKTPTCPPAGFNTRGGFNLTWYTERTWYIQRQMPISYLPQTYEYCVTATYSRLEKPTLLGYTVKVHNHAETRDGKALGPITDICAKPVDEAMGKLEVSPCFLPTLLAGPYWVLDFSVEEGWALVSGGPPTKASGGACKTGSGANDSGLWVFTRAQLPADGVVDRVVGLAQKKGFDTSVLDRIDH